MWVSTPAQEVSIRLQLSFEQFFNRVIYLFFVKSSWIYRAGPALDAQRLLQLFTDTLEASHLSYTANCDVVGRSLLPTCLLNPRP